ncbi:hypothetical protein HYX70_00385 [Candidatus Saccharibacteria bacterium]|nr:hypothetical protein [Candidatus Saccharibacteria bacterium]
MPERYTISNRPGNKKPETSNKLGKKAASTLSAQGLSTGYLVGLVALLIIGTNVLTYLVTASVYKGKITDLEKKSEQLRQKLNQSQSSESNANTKSATGVQINIPQDLRNKIQNAIDSKNYQELSAILAQSVTFALAGSSTTQQSPQQILASLAALQGASGGWNWNLSQSLLQQLQQGSNAQYFGSGAIVGQSGNGYIVAATVGADGQITSIFISQTPNDAAAPNPTSQGTD